MVFTRLRPVRGKKVSKENADYSTGYTKLPGFLG